MLTAVLAYHPLSGHAAFVFVDYLLVHPQWRRCGYGRQLLSHLPSAELIVDEDNRKAIRLYTREGFQAPPSGLVYQPGIGMRVMRRETTTQTAHESPGVPWALLSSDCQRDILLLARNFSRTGAHSLCTGDTTVRYICLYSDCDLHII